MRKCAVKIYWAVLAFVATGPFRINYKIPTARGLVLVNGDQLTRIEANRLATGSVFSRTNGVLSFIWRTGFRTNSGQVMDNELCEGRFR